MRNPTLLAICMHEAGHAIVQLATGPGEWIDYIEVTPSSDTSLGIVHTAASWQPWMRDEPAPAWLIERRRRLAALDVVSLLAGEIAEARWRKSPRFVLQDLGEEAAYRCFEHHDANAHTDGGWVRNRLEWLLPGQEVAGFVRAWLATEQIVAEWFPEIERLGRELARRRRIEDEQLYQLWNEMRDARGEAALRRAAQIADWLGPEQGCEDRLEAA